MGLARLLRMQRRDWDDLAILDPLDSILARFDNSAAWTEEQFFLEGEKEVGDVLSRCGRLDIAINYGCALDFGCGVGRLTRALATRFETCIGADISAEMLDQARLLNAEVPNIRFVQTGATLTPLEDRSIDFIYTSRVLQHVPSHTAVLLYLNEFLRVLRANGVLVAHIPTAIPWIHRIQPRARLWRMLRSAGVPRSVLHSNLGLTPMRMIGVSSDTVRVAIENGHGHVVAVDFEEARPHHYAGATYFVRRR